MSFLKGSASFVRFTVEGELPDKTLEYILDRIISFSFEDIDDNFEEYSIGWVSVLDMFDSEFRNASWIAGDYITLSLRMDERKVSSAILKKYIAKEEERVRREKQIPKLSRSAKMEIKERIRTELVRKSIPIPSVYDLAWNLSEGSLIFFSTNKKAQALLEDHFRETFGLIIKQQIPYTTAETLLEEETLPLLESSTPDIFV